MESTIPFSYNSKTNIMGNPPFVLEVEVLTIDKPEEWATTIMLNVHHKNVLRILAELKENQVIVEHYDGVLNTYIEDRLLLEKSTDFLKDILSQVIEGVTAIAYSGYHHGNLIGGVQYYKTTNPDSPIVVKLAEFRKRVPLEAKAKDVELMEANREDFYAIGRWTLNFLTKSENENKARFSSTEIKDLASYLMSFLESDQNLTAKQMKEMSLAHYYFWSPGQRAQFYTYKVSDWVLTNEEFVDKISKQLQCPSSWDKLSGGFYGLVQAMNDHREKVLLIAKYNGQSKLDYIKFICGCYSHEHIVKGKIKHSHQKVDTVIRACDPDLTAKVMQIVKKCKSIP